MDEFPDVPYMPYKEIRDQIHSGDILLCSGASPMSEMIQLSTESVWSHVGFVLRLEVIHRIFVLESVESVGVWAVPLSNYMLNYLGTGQPYQGRVFLARDPRFEALSREYLIAFSQYAVDLVGHLYDKKEIMGIALRITAEKLGRPLPPRPSDKAFICSEYVEMCYQSVGLPTPRKSLSYVAPRDFAEETTMLWELQLHP
jgi:Permuted papain-like amidase enzyme, YaeF/YiiX, C92 family